MLRELGVDPAKKVSLGSQFDEPERDPGFGEVCLFNFGGQSANWELKEEWLPEAFVITRVKSCRLLEWRTGSSLWRVCSEGWVGLVCTALHVGARLPPNFVSDRPLCRSCFSTKEGKKSHK